MFLISVEERQEGRASSNSQGTFPLQVTGEWRTILMGADNLEKISEDADMRVRFRHLECIDACEKLAVTFYVKSNGECHKFSVVATKGPHDVYEVECEYLL
ncbi:Hypothetical predicted protein [Marmota monax]|uniref:Lipocalin/cytosolic fatty-acid binding domain-containing protein n=1 Tax=Marmota monax TaxID=9995 RepID=A0A5E4B3C1_MARMO|nr:hypothetical protein GHT09_013399 [Marmota monax]VTJ63905.1 Hypothetical predicted protein [Marmota monax]